MTSLDNDPAWRRADGGWWHWRITENRWAWVPDPNANAQLIPVAPPVSRTDAWLGMTNAVVGLGCSIFLLIGIALVCWVMIAVALS